jgi:hypothetical protein
MKSRFLIRGDGRRHEASLREWIAGFIAAIAWVLLVTGLPRPAMSQAVFGAGDANLTVEAYANSSAGVSDDGVFQFDGALRLLGLVPLASQSKLGARAVVEALAGERSEVDLGELSVLWLDRWGRIEYGERQGLPDVLVGYAPNNFTFTGAEFGPASGLSLDPGSGLASILLDRPESGRLLRMASLGATATLASDRSDKIIYVSPKRHGFIGGLSYAHDAGENGDRYGSLFQAGLTHERYVGENVLRYGGSVSVADVDGGGNLRSWNGGISATLHDSWLLGNSAGYDSGGIDADSAWGIVSSVNYNRGAWTAGGFLQYARLDIAGDASGLRRLRVGELGVSYRSNRRLRWFAAYQHNWLEDPHEVGLSAGLLVIGLRATI